MEGGGSSASQALPTRGRAGRDQAGSESAVPGAERDRGQEDRVEVTCGDAVEEDLYRESERGDQQGDGVALTGTEPARSCEATAPSLPS